MQLESSVLSKDEFATWGKDYVLFLHVTSRIKDRPNDDLLGKKGGNGFPYLVFLDAEGNVIAKHNGARNVEGFSKTAETANKFVELKKKADGGDKEAKVDLTLIQLEMGSVSVEDAKKAIADSGVELAGDRKAKFDELLLNAEINEVLQSVDGDNEESVVTAGEKLYKMAQEGRTPKEENVVANFWSVIVTYADKKEDVKAFEQGLGELKERFGSNPRAAKWFEEKEARLEEIKAKQKEG